MLSPGVKQRGIGLIEIMISLSIGIFIISGVIQLWATARNNSSTNLGQATIQDSLRYIVSQLERDASQVGGAGCFSQAFRKNDNYIGSILDDSDVSGATLSRYNIAKMIDGADDTGPLNTDEILFRSSPSSAGIPVEKYSRRGASSNQITLDISAFYGQRLYSEIKQFDVLLAADCSGAVYFLVTNEPDIDGILEFKEDVSADSGINLGFKNKAGSSSGISRLEDEKNANDFEDNVVVGEWDEAKPGFSSSTRPYVYLTSASSTAIYSIGDSQRAQDLSARGQSASCGDSSPQFCALLRNDIEIAEGVQDFQIEYGWHVDGDEEGIVRFGNAKEAINDFNNVDRIRVTLELNALGSGNEPGEITRTYTRTIALRNQIGS